MEADPATEFAYSSDQRKTTIGDFVKILLEDRQFLGAILPRIPVLANRDILAKLHFLEERRQLKQQNESVSMKRQLRQGARVLVRLNSFWDESPSA
mmetsp:Transcript_10806/g.14544  ORF Transcript_10806/g.14544 Transcript_10806/m.14544 type:complete len:96 (+) Transcript_10806:907-1194(+)